MDMMKNLISDEDLESIAGGDNADELISCPRCGMVTTREYITEAYLRYFTCYCGKKYTFEQLSAMKGRDPLEPVCTACRRMLPLSSGQMGTIRVIKCYCGAHYAVND